MSKCKFHFVYLTTNIVNGKQYIGDHSCNDISKDSYLGSGVYFKNALSEYGKINFKREILQYFSSKEEAFNAQEIYIQKYDTLSPNGYNLSPKGGIKTVEGLSSKQEYWFRWSLMLAGEKYGEWSPWYSGIAP